jgi:hypothetical protein
MVKRSRPCASRLLAPVCTQWGATGWINKHRQGVEVEGRKRKVMFIVDRVMSKSKFSKCCHFMHSLDSHCFSV